MIEGEDIVCNTGGCGARIPNHKWAKVKDGAAWFFSRYHDEARCPEHLPDWLREWRSKRDAKTER